MIVQDLIYAALRLNGVLSGPGRTASTYDLADGLWALNSLLNRWLNERLMVYQVARTLVNTVAGQPAYQIGVGAPDWNLPWPPRIERASIVLLSATPGPQELPMYVMATVEEWQAVPLKNTASTFPLWCYYDRAYPIGIFNVWPVPQENDQIALYLWEQIAQFAAVTSTVVLPPGYQRALEYGLAVDLMPRYPAEAVANPLVIQEARDAKAQIKSINATPLIAACDAGVRARRGLWDWRIGDFR